MSSLERAEVERQDPLDLALAHLGQGQAWLVGGRIRDRLLGRASIDSDLALREGAIEAARGIAGASGGSLVVLDAPRDVARVVWPGGASLDLARLTASELDADLLARDFTVNALALPLDAAALARLEAGGASLREALVDPGGGLADLDSALLRVPQSRVLDDDPLRMLRAARLAAELRFEIEPDTAAAIRRRARQAARPAGERQRAELLRLVGADRGAFDVARLDRLGLLEVVLPELAATRGVEQSLPHDRDVYHHCLATLAAAEALEQLLLEAREPAAAGDPGSLRLSTAGGEIEIEQGWIEVLRHFAPRLADRAAEDMGGGQARRCWWRFAALIHDIGKPETQRFDTRRGRFRFHGHDLRGAELIEGLAERLRLGRRESAFLGTVIRHHLRPLHLAASEGASRRSIHRYFRDTRDLGVDIAYLALADNASKGGVRPDFARHLAEVTRALMHAWFEAPSESVSPPLPLDGRELISALDLEAGPLVGQLLEAMQEALATGELRPGDREAALAFTRRQLDEVD